MHYLDIIAQGEEAERALSAMLLAVHGWNATHAEDNRLAVAFPRMQDATVDPRGKVLHPPKPGSLLRVFSNSPQDLTEFSSSPVPARASRLGAIVKSDVQEVPPTAGAVRFVRDREFEKSHSHGAYARRQKKAAERAGREYRPHKPTAPRSFGIAMKSQSSNRAFFVDIRKEESTGPVNLGNVNAYGLCSTGAAVPWF
jgi:CRISPR-associated endoribonuclease Cas6/Csy4 subtype I-F